MHCNCLKVELCYTIHVDVGILKSWRHTLYSKVSHISLIIFKQNMNAVTSYFKIYFDYDYRFCLVVRLLKTTISYTQFMLRYMYTHV